MKLIPLKRVARIRYGLGQPPPLAPDGVPILRATNIYRGRIVDKDLIFARLEDLPLRRCPLLEAGEVLVVRSGAYTGDSALIEPQWAGSCPGYDLRVTPFGISPRFLAYALRAKPAQDHMSEYRQRAAQPHLSREDLASVPIPVRALDVQEAIARFLDTEIERLERLFSLREQVIALLGERRFSVVTAAVSGRLTKEDERVESRLAWLDSLPRSWSTIKLTLVARLGTGHTPSRSVPEYWTDCAIPWVTTGEVQQIRDDRTEVITQTREKISELGMANSSAVLHPAGTVVLSRTASAGYSAILGVDMATSQDFVTWNCSARLLPRFLLFCVRAMRPDLLGRLAMGSTHKTIYMPDVQMLRIPIPSVEEQTEALAVADREFARIDPLIDSLRRQIELLRERRDALITAAVAGELDPVQYAIAAQKVTV